LHDSFRAGTADLLEAGSIAAIDLDGGESFECAVELAAAS
jgi:hypothetical protein